MDNELYENLSKKSSDELKAYIINMSDGYTKDAVETAIAILKERGEAIDDILRTAQVKTCSICNHRQPSPEGLLCDITNQKADFICTCINYSCDEKAVQEKVEKENVETGWGGMMRFYWFVLATGALFTIIFGFINFDASDSICLSLADLVFALGYSALCIYTIVAFAKRLPNAVTLGKIQNYTLIANQALLLLISGLGVEMESNWSYSLPRMIGSIIWAVVFLSYLYGNYTIKQVFPKEKRHMLKYDKPIIWSIVGVIIALFIVGMIEESINEINKPVNELRSYVEQYDSSLSPDPTADFYCKSIAMNDTAVVMNLHDNTYINANISPEQIEYMPIYSRELLLFNGKHRVDKDLIEKCWLAEYGIVLNWYDMNDEFTSASNLSSADIDSICTGVPHYTSATVWQQFLNAWNKQLPVEYLGGDAIYYQAGVKDNAATVYLTFQGISKYDLKYLDHNYLKAYLTENLNALTDHFITLAMLNDLDIVYSFNSDVSKTWQVVVTFTPDEYNNK